MRRNTLLRSGIRKISNALVLFGFFLLLLFSIPSTSFSAPTKWPKLLAPDVSAKAEHNELVEVLVLLDDIDERVMEEAANQNRVKLHRATASDYNQRMQKRKSLMRDLKGRIKDEVADSDLEIKTDYSVLPILHVRVKSKRALDKLIENQKVLSIDENRANTTFLTQSLPLIGRTSTQAPVSSGSGATVAVLDTGVDYTRAAFGSCTTPGPACKVVYAQDFATSDGKLDDNGHGTNVAAIVLGVAPAAKIAALDVFRTDGYAYSSDIINAINWCITNKTTYNIASINMSLGGGRYYSPVDPSDSWGVAIQKAVDAGILVAAASGNSTYSDSMGTPAAYANVVSVGAVYDSNLGGLNWSVCSDSSTFADKVTCFSNSASFLTVLAPGAVINAAGISMSGTSQATPHVAGAAAVLRVAYPTDSVSHTVARLKQGKTVTDSRNGVVTPRVDLVTALGNSSAYTASATPMSGKAPLTVTFDGSASTDTDGTIASYVWNFGDGSTATGKTVTHTYTTEATFSAFLQVTDNQGATSSTTILINTNDPAAKRQLFWSHTLGAASLWNLDSSNNQISYKLYGPFSGWSPISYSYNSNETKTLLWAHTSGMASLWNLDGSDNPISYKLYGPYSGWTPVSYSENSNGTKTLLWAHTSGMASLWNLDGSNNLISYKTHGPYSGWTPVDYYCNNSNGTRTLLWAHTSGMAAIWSLDTSDNLISYKAHGPYSDWTPVDYNYNSNGARTLLWSHTSGMASLWNLDGSDNLTTYKLYGPYSDWTPVDYNDNSDGTRTLLWSHTSGMAAIWSLDTSDNLKTYKAYGPYSGWAPFQYLK